MAENPALVWLICASNKLGDRISFAVLPRQKSPLCGGEFPGQFPNDERVPRLSLIAAERADTRPETNPESDESRSLP